MYRLVDYPTICRANAFEEFSEKKKKLRGKQTKIVENKIGAKNQNCDKRWLSIATIWRNFVKLHLLKLHFGKKINLKNKDFGEKLFFCKKKIIGGKIGKFDNLSPSQVVHWYTASPKKQQTHTQTKIFK